MKKKILSNKERRAAVENALDFDESDFFKLAIGNTIGGLRGARQKAANEKAKFRRYQTRLKDVQTEQVVTFTTSGGKIIITANALTQTGHVRKGLIPLYNKMRELAKVDGKEYILTK